MHESLELYSSDMKDNKPKSAYMIGLQDQILQTAMTAFVQKGIKAVKMDDIAHSLGISKRTLYEIYDNKELLLLEGVKRYKERKDAEMKAFYDACPNVMDIILKAYRMKVEEFNQTCPEFYNDVIRYPSVISYFQKDKERSFKNFVGFLQRGVDEGYFRNDVNLYLVTEMFSTLTNRVSEARIYEQHTLEEIFHNMFFIPLRGLCTNKGVELLKQKIDVKV